MFFVPRVSMLKVLCTAPGNAAYVTRLRFEVDSCAAYWTSCGNDGVEVGAGVGVGVEAGLEAGAGVDAGAGRRG